MQASLDEALLTILVDYDRNMDNVFNAEEQSCRLASKYNLIPIEITQDKMYSYLQCNPSLNYVTNSSILSNVLSDDLDSKASTMAICNYMNPYTPNKRLAIVHSTGTGKTRKSLLAALSYNRDITVVAVHKIQQVPFIKELSKAHDTPSSHRHKVSEVCTVYPGFKKRVDILTCKSISTAMARGDVNRLDFFFKDRVIILDEMHHIRSSGDKGKRETPLFDNIVKTLLRYPNSIILFLTATLLVDTSSEIYGVYTLLKGVEPPLGNQINIATMLDGYISKFSRGNLPCQESEVKCVMRGDGRQWQIYSKHMTDKTSVHSKTMAISRFVTLDDEHASEDTTPIQTIVDSILQESKFDNVVDRYLASIEALQFVSIKAYNLVKYITDPQHTNEPMFIYDSWKKRGGIDRLVDILTMPAIGYSVVMTEQDARDSNKPRKLVALHRLSQSKNMSSIVNKLRDIFNSEENRDGHLIHLILATPKYAESMSLITARSSHIMCVLWNETTAIQVKGRINRKASLPWLPSQERRVRNFNYVIYDPQGNRTVESDIMDASKFKYREIQSVMAVLDRGKLENLYHVVSHGLIDNHIVYPVNCRINNKIRGCSVPINYKDIPVSIDRFLDDVEKMPSLYHITVDTTVNQGRHTGLLNTAIKAIEEIYLRRHLGHAISDKQSNMLRDIDKAFMDIDDNIVHILYFSNNETVEYQRFINQDKRVARMLDKKSNVWIDVHDKRLIEEATTIYEDHITSFVEQIKDQWIFYGFYVVRFTLIPCYRLMRYRDDATIARRVNTHGADKRKISRGEKWEYYKKSELISLLTKLNPEYRAEVLSGYAMEVIFNQALQLLINIGMMVELPI